MEAITELLPVSTSLTPPSTWDKEKDLGDICNSFSFSWKASPGIKPQKVKKNLFRRITWQNSHKMPQSSKNVNTYLSNSVIYVSFSIFQQER